jgi:hypothetical protein
VGGGIISHTIPWFHHLTETSVDQVQHLPNLGNIIGALTPTLINLVIGFIAGILVLLIVSMIQKIWPKSSKA